jgi:hypothetical protein
VNGRIALPQHVGPRIQSVGGEIQDGAGGHSLYLRFYCPVYRAL